MIDAQTMDEIANQAIKNRKMTNERLIAEFEREHEEEIDDIADKIREEADKGNKQLILSNYNMSTMMCEVFKKYRYRIEKNEIFINDVGTGVDTLAGYNTIIKWEFV